MDKNRISNDMKGKIDNILEGYHKKEYDLITVKIKLLDLFNVGFYSPSDKEIREYASDYSQNWSEDETLKSIAYTAYHRGCKRIIKMLNSK